jgi:hypothetical protein
VWCTCPKCGSVVQSIDGGYICPKSWCEWMSPELEYDTVIQKFPVRAGMEFTPKGYSMKKIKKVGYDIVEFRVSKVDGMILKQIKLKRVINDV